MVFGYYHRLSAARRRIYRKSDEILAIALPGAALLRPLAAQLAEALASEERARIERLIRQLVRGLLVQLGAPEVRVEVLAVRPSNRWGELHGLYTPATAARPARIHVWMRTAKRGRVVAFRTLLRTLLHELCHHLDYELLKLPESFHTNGFYQRESSLFRQLIGAEQAGFSLPAGRAAAGLRAVVGKSDVCP